MEYFLVFGIIPFIRKKNQLFDVVTSKLIQEHLVFVTNDY